ncbi:MAG: elongation factor Tu [Nocardioidaceae bacterium]|nr:elongation factor Tu [Nocardioidaceae bacterium]
MSRHTSRVRVRLELWTKEQGGRHTPVFDGYRPDFRASTEGHGDVDLGPAAVKLPADNPMLVPGTQVEVDVEPVDVSAWANVSTGLVLGVLEGDQQVGTATVLGS